MAAEERLFDFTETDPDRFRVAATGGPMARLYGGQVIAQTLAVAQLTAPAGRHAHSCHAYFVRPGDPATPIDFVVERDSDGRSFSARRVVVTQSGRTILNLAASFQVAEDGPAHAVPMPDVPGPEELAPMDDVIAALGDRLPPRNRPFWWSDFGVEFRPVETFGAFDPAPAPPRRHFWFRLRHRVGDDVAVHQRWLAYASDMYIMQTGLLPLGIGCFDPAMQDASLDHAIWFHARFRIDDWLLYALDSPAVGHARAFGRGTVFTADGRVVASVAQEGLVRMPPGWTRGTP